MLEDLLRLPRGTVRNILIGELGDNMDIATCQGCPLYQNLDPRPGRKHLPVPGEGPVPCQIMVIGEAPGADEADSGRPLVGASGKRFDMLVRQAGFRREGLFITNLLKHRPPKNRPPQVKEVKACAHFLEQQLLEVQPSVVITLGRHAAHYFDKSIQLVKDHGMARRFAEDSGLPFLLIPMYHPAAALYNGGMRETLIEDFKKIPVILKKIGSEN